MNLQSKVYLFLTFLIICWVLVVAQSVHGIEEPVQESCFGWVGIDLTDAINDALATSEDAPETELFYAATTFELLNLMVGKMPPPLETSYLGYDVAVGIGENMAYILVYTDSEVVCHLVTLDIPEEIVPPNLKESA